MFKKFSQFVEERDAKNEGIFTDKKGALRSWVAPAAITAGSLAGGTALDKVADLTDQQFAASRQQEFANNPPKVVNVSTKMSRQFNKTYPVVVYTIELPEARTSSYENSLKNMLKQDALNKAKSLNANPDHIRVFHRGNNWEVHFLPVEAEY